METREQGSAICCSKTKCVLGKKSTGTRTRVLVSLNCPKDMKPIGTHHTHPGGRAELSSADIINLRKAGLSIGCVTGKQGTKCYKIKSKSIKA